MIDASRLASMMTPTTSKQDHRMMTSLLLIPPPPLQPLADELVHALTAGEGAEATAGIVVPRVIF